jgi:hypothetical protein
MAYGHAERVVAAIRLLEAETKELLSGLDKLDPEQAQWLEDIGRPSTSYRSRWTGDDSAEPLSTWRKP